MIDGDFLEHGATVLIVGFYAFLFILVIIVLLRLARYFGRAGKEQQRIRMELTKLADEVHQLRKNSQERHEGNHSNKPTA